MKKMQNLLMQMIANYHSFNRMFINVTMLPLFPRFFDIYRERSIYIYQLPHA